MGNESKIHNLLNGSGGKHGKAGLTAAHNVAMVAENAKGMISESARGYVENARQTVLKDDELPGFYRRNNKKSGGMNCIMGRVGV